jgi:hypothetical protein
LKSAVPSSATEVYTFQSKVYMYFFLIEKTVMDFVYLDMLKTFVSSQITDEDPE